MALPSSLGTFTYLALGLAITAGTLEHVVVAYVAIGLAVLNEILRAIAYRGGNE